MTPLGAKVITRAPLTPLDVAMVTVSAGPAGPHASDVPSEASIGGGPGTLVDVDVVDEVVDDVVVLADTVVVVVDVDVDVVVDVVVDGGAVVVVVVVGPPAPAGPTPIAASATVVAPVTPVSRTRVNRNTMLPPPVATVN